MRREADAKYKQAREAHAAAAAAAAAATESMRTAVVTTEDLETFKQAHPIKDAIVKSDSFSMEQHARPALMSALSETRMAEEQKAREEGGSLYFFSSMVQVIEDSFSMARPDADAPTPTDND